MLIDLEMECFQCRHLLLLVTQVLAIKPIVNKISCVTVFIGRERYDVGKIKGIVVNPARGVSDTFGPLISNSINNPYVDPGRYND